MKWEGRPEGDDDLASRAKRRLPCSPSNGEPEGNLTVDLRFKLRLASGRKRRAVRSPDDVSKRKKKAKKGKSQGSNLHTSNAQTTNPMNNSAIPPCKLFKIFTLDLVYLVALQTFFRLATSSLCPQI